MFKDYDKYLSTSLKVYLFLLIIVFIMKLVGLDYFGLELNNLTLIKISNYLSSNHFGDLYFFISVYIQFYFYLCLVCKKSKLYKQALIGSLLNYGIQIILMKVLNIKMNILYSALSISIMFIIPMIVNKRIMLKRQFKYIILITLYQLLSLVIRNINLHYEYGNFLVDSLLNIDQLLMLAITYNIYFLKGGIKLCGEEQVVGLFLQMKKNLLKLPKKLQKFLCNFKQLKKEEKLTFIIYFILSLFWNLLTIVIILLVATINDTVIECIFILISFWISKKIFKKAFHLKNMVQCFVLSNLTYYVLNRITAPIGISILIPIMLGTGLAYITSKFVKKKYKPLYKGMPLDEFNKTISKVVDKDSLKYLICYDYFIERENAIFLGRKYNYTEAGIRQIASRINKQIKALN